MKTVWGWTAAVVWILGPAFALAQAPVELPGGVIDLPLQQADSRHRAGRPAAPELAARNARRQPGWALGWLASTAATGPLNRAICSRSRSSIPSPARWWTIQTRERSEPQSRCCSPGWRLSADGTTLYGTIVSASDPEGKKAAGDTGSGIQVYTFASGRVIPKRVINIPLQRLAAGTKDQAGLGRRWNLRTAVPRLARGNRISKPPAGRG